MIARMPELSLSETSARLKPSRLSISSWVRMRSAPPLALCMKLEPSSTMAAHCEAAASVPSLALSTGAACCCAFAASASSASPHSAASASWSIWSLPRLMVHPLVRAKADRAESLPVQSRQGSENASLDDDFLEQHRIDAVRTDRHIDAAGKLFLEAVEAGGAVEVGGPQLAQIGLERVHHPRHRRLDLRLRRRVGKLEHDLDLEILGALATGAG